MSNPFHESRGVRSVEHPKLLIKLTLYIKKKKSLFDNPYDLFHEILTCKTYFKLGDSRSYYFSSLYSDLDS